MTVAIGKFGPYIRHNGAFYSVPKDIDPLDADEKIGIEIIENKRKADAEKLIKSFTEDEAMRIENGRWGPYIKYGKLNVKIPKGKEPEELTYADCKALAEIAEKEPKKFSKKFAKTAEKETKKPAKKSVKESKKPVKKFAKKK